ncbi:uncharacterized protein LOC143898436 [Temnothorax americanus]|uniref:uncharacterized protein LOC143898436 n=1 Tax=Temnothorax americanus TaxID=1964332 RepID=UPI004067BA61
MSMVRSSGGRFLFRCNRNMVRSYKRKTARVVDLEVIRLAVNDVKEKKGSVRTVAKKYGINYRTLYRYCDKFDAPQQRIASLENTAKTPSPPRDSGQEKSSKAFVPKSVSKTPESFGYAKPKMNSTRGATLVLLANLVSLTVWPGKPFY